MNRGSPFPCLVGGSIKGGIGNELERMSHRMMFGFRDGPIPCGILMASMTGVRLSFRGKQGDARSVHFTPLKRDPKPSSGPFLARFK